MRKIKVAARESRLSQLQVKEAFSHYPNLEYELCLLSSFGDKHKSISLLDGEAPADIFTRELDRALLDGNADVAVHSAKDLPYPLNPELEVVALFPAFDTTDSLVSRDHLRLCDLPSGSTIGTSSPLRKRGLETLRSDLSVVGIRGTIEERVRQVREGKIDAAIVATCALKRLGMEEEVSEVLPFATHPLQGFLAITARRGNEELHQLFADGNLLKRQGRVKLVGFGPGNPDLLTMAAVKALDEADVIFYDDLIGKDYLSRLSAEKIYVGKRSGSHHTEQDDINRMLLDAARCGKQVVRLKGGDPDDVRPCERRDRFFRKQSCRCHRDTWHHHGIGFCRRCQGEPHPPTAVIISGIRQWTFFRTRNAKCGNTSLLYGSGTSENDSPTPA
jgi:uroporphyrinogen III methyltransferase/synthase